MNIQKISAFYNKNLPQNTTIKQDQEENTPQQEPLKEYKPHAYMDYNINFGARLFRTPANFYAQPFNQKGMPAVMKDYLNADYEDRKNIPPAQMMSIVYDDLNDAESLQQVKEIYPDEPLFQNLHDVNYDNFRSGALGDIMLLKDDEHPLFKDGSDDLGMYLIRKIYVECKSMKEIVPDFRKDISAHYKDIADVDYTTLKHFGIKYPDQGFWKSLTATREEFPYTRKPRKDIQSRLNGTERQERTPKKIENNTPTHKLEDHKINRVIKTIMESGGDTEETKRQLKKKCRDKNSEKEINFICKYLGPIMSITLERIHASQEMIDFYESHENSTKSKRMDMQGYWDEHDDLKKLQSRTMRDTIKLFFLTYGADGENEDFKELLEYANSIKPRREEEKRLHDEKQRYYDELFAELDKEKAANNSDELKTEETTPTPEDFKKKLDDLLKQYNARLYKFEIDGDEYNLVFDPKDVYTDMVKIRFGDMTPDAWIQKYSRYTYENIDVKHILWMIKNLTTLDLPIPEDKLPSADETTMAIAKEDKEFQNRFSKETNAAITALTCEYFNKTQDVQTIQKLYYDTRIASIFGDLSNIIEKNNLGDTIDKNTINEKYKEYIKPLSNKETNKITTELVSQLKQFEPREQDDIRISVLLGALSLMVQVKDDNSRAFRSNLGRFIQNNYGGASRAILDKNISDDMRIELITHILCEFDSNNPGSMMQYIRNNNVSNIFFLRNKSFLESK